MARERLQIDLDNESAQGDGERIHIARYRFAASFAQGKRVLDVACGVGYGSAILARAGAASVTGMDISDEAIAFAREHYKNDHLSYRTGSAFDLSEFKNLDLVVSIETIEHIPKPRLFLDQIAAALGPGGGLIVSTPNRLSGNLRDQPANPFHVQEWTASEFYGMLAAYFQDVKLYGQVFEFQPLGFPGSRTLVRALSRLAAPHLARAQASREVQAFPPASRWPFAPEITVAVCIGLIT